MNILLKKKNGTIKRIKHMKFNKYLEFHNNFFFDFFDFIKSDKMISKNGIQYNLIESIIQNNKSCKFLEIFLASYTVLHNCNIEDIYNINPEIDIYNI